LLNYLRTREYTPYLFDPHTGLPGLANSGASSTNMIAVPRGMSLPEAVYQPWPEVEQDGGRRAGQHDSKGVI
jgi:hypothetical protein